MFDVLSWYTWGETLRSPLYSPHKGCDLVFSIVIQNKFQINIRFATDLKRYDTHVLSQQYRVSIYILPLWVNLNCIVNPVRLMIETNKEIQLNSSVFYILRDIYVKI